MKIYTKIILDKDDNLIYEKSIDYFGKIENAMGIHYDYDSTRSAKKMEKQAKREKKLAERKAKKAEKLLKEGVKKNDDKKRALDTSVPLSLDAITDPNKDESQD